MFFYSTNPNDHWKDMRIPPVLTATVVTPTIASNKLTRAIESVLNQKTKYRIQHLLVIDGPEAAAKLPQLHDNIKLMRLPWNVGANGFYGHRIYAASSHLINTDAVFFLDEDNFYSEDHVETCMEKLNGNIFLDFTYSFRNICDVSGTFIAIDRFESIGKAPLNLVDTSSYCFRTPFLEKYGHLWHNKWGADRMFFQTVKDLAKYESTGLATLNYCLDGNPGSPTREFFEHGNQQHGWLSNGFSKL